MSILLYHFKELTECISEVGRIEAKVNSNKKEEWSITRKEEEEEDVKQYNEKEEMPMTLDNYFINNKIPES
ncbi:MAG: hypothetical protein M3298_03955 [Thermoproteota archaeon]|nr:hypothetical protein [Thermoproteota archaeon]